MFFWVTLALGRWGQAQGLPHVRKSLPALVTHGDNMCKTEMGRNHVVTQI